MLALITEFNYGLNFQKLIMMGPLGNLNLEKIISNLLCLFPTTSKLSTQIC